MTSYTFDNRIFSGSSNSARHYFLLFVIWPFMAFITAIANYTDREARRTVYLFLIYYGLSFVNNNEAVDAFRYAMKLESNAELPFSSFFDIVGGLYATDTSVDIVEPLISFIVSRLTSHYALYFAVWAALFGFFYLKSINLLHEEFRKNPGWNSSILLFFFIMIIPVTFINGPRMWTAAWIFFFGAYHVVLNRDPRYLLVALSASLVHWSFMSANAILLIYFLAGNRNLIYIPLALSSFVVPQMISPLLRNISLRLGGGLQNRFNNYTSEAYMEAVSEMGDQTVWFMRIGGFLVLYFLLAAIVLIQFRYGFIMKGRKEKNLFSFILLFLAFVNFGMQIPSFGERFVSVFFLFATLYLFRCYVRLQDDKISLVILAGLFPMLLYSGINFRMGTESINAWLLTPGLGIPLAVPAVSLTEFLF